MNLLRVVALGRQWGRPSISTPSTLYKFSCLTRMPTLKLDETRLEDTRIRDSYLE